METSIHKQLKHIYAASPEQTEIQFAGYRIDAISRTGELVEIQHAGLSALRSKTRDLLEHSDRPKVRIVKPIVARKWIVTLDAETGIPVRKRQSPKRGQLADAFMDLVHFTQVFPHPRLTIEVLLVNLEEHRQPKEGHRFRRKNYTTLEQNLISVESSQAIRWPADLWRLLTVEKLPRQFDTAQLGKSIQKPRWFAQKVAYCLRQCQAIEIVGKQGNSQLYSKVSKRKRSA